MAVEPFDTVDLIRTKRDHGALSTAQIDWLIDAYTRGYVADEQMSAMTMAIFLNGMQRDEIRDLTQANATSLPPPVMCRLETSAHSAHRVRPYEAFSTLAPVMIRPSSTIAATPTGNFE